jgi:hypothetical protein
LPKDIDPEKFVDPSFWKALDMNKLKSDLDQAKSILISTIEEVEKTVVFI